MNKFAARSTSEMWWDSTIDIFDQAFKHFYRVGQEIACLVPIGIGNIALSRSEVWSTLRKFSPNKRKTASQIPRGVISQTLSLILYEIQYKTPLVSVLRTLRNPLIINTMEN